MSEPLVKYWAWNYEMRQLGSFSSENYTGHSKAVVVYLAADVDALLRQREEVLAKRICAYNKLRDGYDEFIAQLQAKLAAMTAERDALVWSHSPAMADARINQLLKRVKELERELSVEQILSGVRRMAIDQGCVSCGYKPSPPTERPPA